MSTLNPAANAIIQAMSVPGLKAPQLKALNAALQVAMASTDEEPIERASTKKGRVRQAPAPKPERKADAFDFTKEAINALPLPRAGEYMRYDTGCPQLAVRVRPGAKSFYVVMWDATRRKAAKKFIGKTDMLTLEQARKTARNLVADVTNGKDIRRPAVDSLTLQQLVETWHTEKARKVRTADELKTKVLHYAGRLAHRSASEITLQDIGTIHTYVATKARKRVMKRVKGELQWAEIGEPGLPATADKWRAILSAVYAWGLTKGLVMGNPCEGIEPTYDAKAAERTNYLRGAELLRFWKALEADSDADARDALMLLLRTGQRRGNVLQMRWRDLDLDAGRWQLSAAVTKQKKVQTTPLTTQARVILKRRWDKRETDSAFVFPATRGEEDAAMNETRLRDAWARICTKARISDLRIHDLRHTAGSWLARLGANEAIRQKALGHQTPAMAARYAHLELDPVADALQRMGDAIESAATKPPAKVTQISTKKVVTKKVVAKRAVGRAR